MMGHKNNHIIYIKKICWQHSQLWSVSCSLHCVAVAHSTGLTITNLGKKSKVRFEVQCLLNAIKSKDHKSNHQKPGTIYIILFYAQEKYKKSCHPTWQLAGGNPGTQVKVDLFNHL